jgi:hypothetical protein
MRTEKQKKEQGERMRAGKTAKAEEADRKEKLLLAQAAAIKKLRAMAQISEKQVGLTAEFKKTGQVNIKVQDEIEGLREEVAALKEVLAHSGALPKKVATKPWSSRNKPFHKDIFKTKEKHSGYELGFISEDELDNYKASGYSVANGGDYGEKPGVLKRKRMIGVERKVEAAEEDRTRLRDFNRAQRTSALQKVEDIRDSIHRVSGHRPIAKMGYEVHK